MKILYPYKLWARYKDDYEILIEGNNEDDCISKMAGMIGKHGEVTWYSGYCDEDYVDGEYVGRENFIH